MEALIVVSAAIAVGALVAILWGTDRELKEKNRRLEIAESRLSGGEPALSTVSPNPPEKIDDLQEQLSALAAERSELLTETENLRERLRHSETSRDSVAAEGEAVELRNENGRVRTRVEALEKELHGHRERVVFLGALQAKIPELEQQIARLREEHGQCLKQIESLEGERQASRERIQKLEGAQSKVLELQSQVARLRGENSTLSAAVGEFKSSLQVKLKAQLAGLQELCRELDSRKE